MFDRGPLRLHPLKFASLSQAKHSLVVFSLDKGIQARSSPTKLLFDRVS